VRSVLEALGRRDLARLRLGIGPFRRPLVDFVLEQWTDAEWAKIDALDAPFARFMELLRAAGDLCALAKDVNPADFWLPQEPGEALDSTGEP
jgi:PTH1 family peptidyl-tRNA hydrolase